MTASTPRILIAEDDVHIGVGLEELLGHEGYAVRWVQRGEEVVGSVQAFEPDLLVLDVMLPEVDGFSICRQLRKQHSSLPILMLTAKGEELDKVRGLELGADDYMTKPFGVRELLARIQALLRRAGSQKTTPSDSEPSAQNFVVGEAEIDPQTFELVRQGQVVSISTKELNLLRCFHNHRGRVLSRDFLLDQVWGQHYLGNTRTLDQVIVKLRRLIGEPEGKPIYIITVHGTGYKLTAEPGDGKL